MGLSLEFLMDNGQVVTFASCIGAAANHPDLAAVAMSLDCGDMGECGIVMDQYALLQGGEVVRLAEGIRLLWPEEVKQVYKAYQNNRPFMVRPGSRLLSPIQTEVYFESLAMEGQGEPGE